MKVYPDEVYPVYPFARLSVYPVYPLVKVNIYSVYPVYPFARVNVYPVYQVYPFVFIRFIKFIRFVYAAYPFPFAFIRLKFSDASLIYNIRQPINDDYNSE